LEEIRKCSHSGKKKLRIKLSWFKAHAATRGNEIAERLAKEAARSGGTEYELTGFQKAPHIKQIEREPGKQGKESGQRAKKLQQTIISYTSIQAKIQNKAHPKITTVLTGHRMTKALAIGT
jgi:hypothetical protein